MTDTFYEVSGMRLVAIVQSCLLLNLAYGNSRKMFLENILGLKLDELVKLFVIACSLIQTFIYQVKVALK